jgi:hypothetical protein
MPAPGNKREIDMKILRKTNLRSQRGVSKMGLLLVAVLLGFFFTFGLKVGPIYVDHNLIVGLCQDLIDNGEANNMTVSDLRNRVSSTLRINNITDFDLSSIRMRKESDEAIITVAYEKRVPLIANLDIVAVFDSTLE